MKKTLVFLLGVIGWAIMFSHNLLFTVGLAIALVSWENLHSFPPNKSTGI